MKATDRSSSANLSCSFGYKWTRGLHEKLLAAVLPLLVPFIAGMPGCSPTVTKKSQESEIHSDHSIICHGQVTRVFLPWQSFKMKDCNKWQQQCCFTSHVSRSKRHCNTLCQLRYLNFFHGIFRTEAAWVVERFDMAMQDHAWHRMILMMCHMPVYGVRCGRFSHCNEILLLLPLLKHFTCSCPRFTCEPGEGHHGFGVPLVSSCYRHCRWFGRQLLRVDVGGSATGPWPDAWTRWKIPPWNCEAFEKWIGSHSSCLFRCDGFSASGRVTAYFEMNLMLHDQKGAIQWPQYWRIIFNIVITMSIFTPCLNHVLPLSMLLRRSEDCNDELLIARLRASFSVARLMGGRCVGRNGGHSKCTKTDLIYRIVLF